MIDYNQFVTRDQLDMQAYEEKFTRARRWLEQPEDYKNSDKGIKEYGEMLWDPTIFAYLHQRYNNKPLKYYPYQDLIANDPHRFKYFRAANQIGKSMLLDSLAARNIILDHGYGHNEGIISRSLDLSTFQMRRIKGLLNSMPEIQWKEIKGQADSLFIISVDIKDDEGKVKYTNYLVCAPCSGGALGYDFHSLNLDEFEFWEKVDPKIFFNQVAQPRTYHTKGKITIFSNPNGEDHFGAELEKLGTPDGNRKFHTYIFNYLDCPGNTLEEYKQLEFELDRREFESTAAAIRTSSSDKFFTHDEIVQSEGKDLTEMSMIGKYPFFFLDVGYVTDQCCLVGGYIELGEGYDATKQFEHNKPYIHLYIPIIHLYPKGYPLSKVIGTTSESMDTDGWHQEKSVKDYLVEWKVGNHQPEFGFDATGNKGMLPLFDNERIQYRDITFSGPEKSAYWTRFKYFMEKRLLHRVKHKQWEDQAKQAIAVKSARGYWLINSKTTKGADAKKIPDDCLDATAGLIAIADPQNYTKESLVII